MTRKLIPLPPHRRQIILEEEASRRAGSAVYTVSCHCGQMPPLSSASLNRVVDAYRDHITVPATRREKLLLHARSVVTGALVPSVFLRP